MDCCGDFLIDYQWTDAEIFPPIFPLRQSHSPSMSNETQGKETFATFVGPLSTSSPRFFFPSHPPWRWKTRPRSSPRPWPCPCACAQSTRTGRRASPPLRTSRRAPPPTTKQVRSEEEDEEKASLQRLLLAFYSFSWRGGAEGRELLTSSATEREAPRRAPRS